MNAMCTRLMTLAVLASACGIPNATVELVGDGDPMMTSASELSVSSADAAELLAFVNHPATTAVLLDDAVALDARAAGAIVAHRDGADSTSATADDDLFGSLDELDHVAYVGDAALAKLLAWALAHPVAKAETVEGVTFTSEQVSAVVWGVNQSTSDELDDGLGLETRAANSLLAKKPFTSIGQMGAVAYVGTSALNLLRGHAADWAAKRAGTVTLAGTFDGVSFDEATAKVALKLANVTTLQGLLDGGLPVVGAAPIVGNRPYTTLAQVSAVSGVGAATMTALRTLAALQVKIVVPLDGECDGAQRVCGRFEVCVGLTLGPTGVCRPGWMANTFRSGTEVAIPDGNASGASIGVTVGGLATVPEDVVVHLELDHPRKQDLRILLTQPSSAQSVVWEVNSAGDARVVMGGTVERDSSANGVWMLTVIDTVSGSVGTLNGWSLELTSRMD